MATHVVAEQGVGSELSTHASPGRASALDLVLEFEAVLAAGIGADLLAQAARNAARHGVEIHRELLANGLVDALDYTSALARVLVVPVVQHGLVPDPYAHSALGPAHPCAFIVPAGGARTHVIEATGAPALIVAHQVRALQASGIAVALASAAAIAHVRETAAVQAGRAEMAVNALLRSAPERSAATGWTWGQVLTPGLGVVVLAGGLFVVPDATIAAVTGVMALPFLAVTGLRLIALREVARRHRGQRMRVRPLPSRALPTYSVLVPLFREAKVLADLIAALSSLDYPRAKLEILLLIEQVDLEMQAALLNLVLPAHFRVVLVPDCAPRTKPKALNYGLDVAAGELIVVYDAEDRPQPGQLRRAAEIFARAPANLGCVQACLNIYNPHQGFFARQFTIEYSALFDAVLPALERLALPVPLGGTSNHFRRETLVEIGAWDPFNVTEDADLGIRLARRGFRTRVLASTTWEEAPTTFGVWFRQRTRWIKGWMQTWLVHTRDLAALRRDLGRTGAWGLHVILGGLIGSAMAQPIFYALVIYQLASGELLAPSETRFGTTMLWICWGNLTAGYLISILVGAISVWRRQRRMLALHALMMPAYWLLIAVACYRAAYQLIRDPYLWEKTPHGAARPRRRRPTPARWRDARRSAEPRGVP